MSPGPRPMSVPLNRLSKCQPEKASTRDPGVYRLANVRDICGSEFVCVAQALPHIDKHMGGAISNGALRETSVGDPLNLIPVSIEVQTCRCGQASDRRQTVKFL